METSALEHGCGRGGFRRPENTGLVQVRIADAFAQPLVGGRIAARKLRHRGRSDGAQALPALREEQAAREGQQYEEQFAHSYYGESGLMQSYVFFGNVRAPERKSSQKGQNYPG